MFARSSPASDKSDNGKDESADMEQPRVERASSTTRPSHRRDFWIQQEIREHAEQAVKRAEKQEALGKAGKIALQLAEKHRQAELANLTKELDHVRRLSHDASQAAIQAAEREAQIKAKMHDLGPAPKKTKLSRAQRKLQGCPGITEPSNSGKMMKPLPEIWAKGANKNKHKAESQKRLQPSSSAMKKRKAAATLKVNDITGEDGCHAGLVGLDSTFTFSLRDFREGLLRGRAESQFSLTELLVKQEKDHGPTASSAPAGLPKPDFTEVKQESLSGTIPWETPAKPKVKEEPGLAMASQHSQVLAHHHHLIHLPPAPRNCPAQLAVSSCLAPVSPSLPAQLSVWCDDTKDCRFPPSAAVSTCKSTTAAAPSRDDSDEEERFTAGMKRMVTRAELHKKHFK